MIQILLWRFVENAVAACIGWRVTTAETDAALYSRKSSLAMDEQAKLTVVRAIHEHVEKLEAGFGPPAKYPGVTKVLSGTGDKTFLEVWRKRIGEAEADRILTESQNIGHSLDMLVQLSFDDNFEQATHAHEAGYDLYRQLKKELAKVDPIALQLKVWSDKQKVMGFLDLVGYYDSVLSIIDIKNTRTSKKREFVEDYFMQCALYAICIHDLLGINIKQLVLLVGDRSSTVPQVFVARTKDYVQKALHRTTQYHQLTGTGPNGSRPPTPPEVPTVSPA